jgi:hypothetical protein
MKKLDDGLGKPVVHMRAHQLLCIVCVQGGLECPLMDRGGAREVLAQLKRDPTVTIQLESDAECVPHFSTLSADEHAQPDCEDVFNRKRDLDVLQRLGLVPGSIRRARYLIELLFERVATPDGICAYDTPGWEGCPLARSGSYESVRAKGWQEIVYHRTEKEMAELRRRNVEHIENGERLFMRPHHLMCLACGYAGGENDCPRPNDTLYEILLRIRREPEVPITLVEGCCMACDCCDGFHPETGRCVHAGGLIRDYKKDLDVFQKLGLMPGATMKARELIELIFERIPATTEVCGYGDGVETSHEWAVCSGPDGNAGYQATRKKGLF